MIATIQIILGLALLAGGGEGVIRGAVGVARRLGLSELLIGLTLVGFGTSAPELVTSISAAFRGSPGIALGNVLGSNIANILLILALVAIIRPIAVSPVAASRDATLAIVASAVLAALALALGQLSRPVGALLLAGLVGYVGALWLLERKGGEPARVHEEGSHLHDPTPRSLWLSALLATGGLVLLVLGAELLVGGAITMARRGGISEAVIGLTIVAVGTSLPELVVTLTAALRGRPDVAFGNIAGSNIYNILGILGMTALVHPISVPVDIGMVDWFALLGSAVMFLAFSRTGARIVRIEGIVLIVIYGIYVSYLLFR